MSQTKTFKSYNFVTGAVDGTLAYDFGDAPYYPEQEETYSRPKKRERIHDQEWVREDAREHAAAHRPGVPLFAAVGSLCVIVLFVMVLLAQIQLVNVSDHAADMESRITELEAERDKLTVEYETVFNLKTVEEYAVDVLGMQEPDDQQIYYLTNVASADRAVIVTDDSTSVLSLGQEDLIASVKAYFD